MNSQRIDTPTGATCPSCGSDRVAVYRTDRTILGACVPCRPTVIWEMLPADAPADVDGRKQPFRKSCDNCAFHRNSPERSDAEAWEALEMDMAFREKPFYCHKGVPLAVEGEAGGSEHGFQYPRRPDGTADPAQMRLCAGFIAWWRKLSTDPVPGLDTSLPPA